MEISHERSGDVVVVVPVGRVDAVTSDKLEQSLLGLVAQGEAKLVLEMRAVEYISSAGLRVLLRLARKQKERSGRIVLSSLGPAVRQVFELAGFVSLFEMEASRELAITRLANAPSP